MILFKCHDCGAEFEDPHVIANGGGDIGEDAYQCPECGSFYFNSADKCDICGKLYLIEDSTFENSHACDECLEKIVIKAMGILERNMTTNELNAFYDMYDTIGGDFLLPSNKYAVEEEGKE